MIDYTKLLNKLDKDPANENQGLSLRVGIIDTVNSDGSVDLLLSGGLVPDVPVLDAAPVYAGAIVQVLATRGSLLVLGTTQPGGISPWTDYVPVFTTSGGGANIGSTGVIKGRYRRNGGMIDAIGYMLFSGSGANAGSGGAFTHSLPIAAATVTDMAWEGTARFRSSGDTGHYDGVCEVVSGGSTLLFYESSQHTPVDSAAPFSWAVGNFIRWQISYEPAA